MNSIPNQETTGKPHESLNRLPWEWYLGIVAVIAGACAVLVAGWEMIPDPFPSHWNAGGEPDSFREKQVAGVLVVVLSIPFLFLVTGVMAGLVDHSRQTIHDSGIEADRARMLSNLVQPAVAAFCFVGAIVTTLSNLASVFGLLQGGWSFWGMLSVIVLLILVFFRRSATIHQQVETVYPSEESRKTYKWGMFYFNPDDDDMIINSGGLNVPNFGNKYFWVLFAFLVGIIVFITTLANVAD
ncbi:DUF1648 domain-containing protein [Corynebacterium suedekumii]|uniref:DUF1648 domain-containing protein n=1 Tax=Corynebacterium suedekumii TaxID=3049801 RepID=A0ABY8VNH5_9CORY|nr:DUF1648 domain-containing protein [Corynebacterium suedekumii]WIM71205.1 DUF1648 domain-containing protein [Corynebacterium suedekumii]